MTSNKQYIAIDLGSTHISSMAGEILADGTLKILGVESKNAEDVKYGIVEQRTGASSKVIDLKKLLQNSSKIKEISVVSVAIGAKTMKLAAVSVSRFVGNSNIVSDALLLSMLDECKRNFQHPSLTIFDIIPTSYYLDNKRMDDPAGQTGMQITGNYHLVVGSTMIKENLEGCFDRTGLVVEHTPLVVESLSAALLEAEERESGCALINLGATTTTLAIYYEDALQQLLVVPLGAKNITKDIQELGISEANAERLKCLKGCALESLVDDPINIQMPSLIDGEPQIKVSTKFLAKIIEARLEEILQPIFDALCAIKHPLDGGVVLTGGGCKMNGIIDFCVEKLSVYTRIGNHSEWLSEDTDPKYFDPFYAQLIGSIVLTDEYRENHPIEITIKEPSKKPKLPNKLGEMVKQKVIDYFSDDNKMT